MKCYMKTVILLTALLWAGQGIAQDAKKTVYIPEEWRANRTDTLLYKESDPDNKYTWSKSRSVESDNVIIFWDKFYGSKKPSESPAVYRVDEQDLLKKCEDFYDLEINKLGFVDPVNSNVAKYKIMVLLNHTADWVCYGGGYDYQISALWLGPSACKPVGSAVAHEVGHSFHYMCYAEHSGHKNSSTDNTGFHLACGNGQAIWEQTAQWQSLQSYPDEMYSQSINVFRNSHNYAFSHEWHRYQSYWFLYYLCQYYNDLTTVAQVWNTPMTGQTDRNASDFNQALMKLKGLKAADLFKLYHDYASRLASWDLEACKPYRDAYIGDFTYRCVQTAQQTYQVALASTPQSSGFNIVPLEVPAAGTKVTTHFTALKDGSALANGDPAEMMNGETQWGKSNRTKYIPNSNYLNRAFRLGYAALMKDGTRQYFSADSLYCTGVAEVSADVEMTVPEGVSRLWLIVTPAPKKYVAHKWTEGMANAEHWPYRFQLEGTDLASNATVYVEPIIDGRPIADITLTYDVYFPASSSVYPGATFTIAGQAAAQLGTALQMKSSDIHSKLVSYSANGPANGKIMFYACNPATGSLEKRGSTANGYGHWFNASGKVSDYGSGYVYSEMTPATLSFTIGQYPGKCRNGSDYTISQALYYKKSDSETATARLVFRIHLSQGTATATLASIDYADPTAVKTITTGDRHRNEGIYTLRGQKVSTTTTHGIYIVNGKKVIR